MTTLRIKRYVVPKSVKLLFYGQWLCKNYDDFSIVSVQTVSVHTDSI